MRSSKIARLQFQYQIATINPVFCFRNRERAWHCDSTKPGSPFLKRGGGSMQGASFFFPISFHFKCFYPRKIEIKKFDGFFTHLNVGDDFLTLSFRPDFLYGFRFVENARVLRAYLQHTDIARTLLLSSIWVSVLNGYEEIV